MFTSTKGLGVKGGALPVAVERMLMKNSLISEALLDR